MVIEVGQGTIGGLNIFLEPKTTVVEGLLFGEPLVGIHVGLQDLLITQDRSTPAALGDGPCSGA